jgi:hypothetical protein
MTALINSPQSPPIGSAVRDQTPRSRRRTGRVPGEPRHMSLIRTRLGPLAATVSLLAIGIPVAGASAAVPMGLSSQRGVMASAPQARPPVTDSGPTTVKGPTISGGTVTKDPTASLQFASATTPFAISLLSGNSGGTVASGP